MPQEITWQEDAHDMPKAAWSEGGFEVRIRSEYDHDPDLSKYGEFSDRYRPGAIKHEQGDPRTLDWFHPAIAVGDLVREYLGAGGRTLREARRDAASHVRFLKRRVETHGLDWSTHAVVAQAYREGVKLGESGWAEIEDDCPEADLSALARSLAAEAMEDARSSLLRLCSEPSARTGGAAAPC